MKKLEYQKPIARMVKTKSVPLLAGTLETLRFNPGQGTTDALGRRSDSQEWDNEDDE